MVYSMRQNGELPQARIRLPGLRPAHKKTGTSFPVPVNLFGVGFAIDQRSEANMRSLSESARLGSVGARSVGDVVQAAILLAILLNQATGHKVLQLFVGAQTEHFFASADGISSFQVLVDHLKELVEAEGSLVGKNFDEFVSDMIGYAA